MKHQRSPAARSRRAGRRSQIRDPKETSHSSLEEFLRSLSPGNDLGDSASVRNKQATRVVFQNINGVPSLADGCKQQQINSWLQEDRVGIALFSEINRHWKSVPEGHKWRDRMRQVATKGYATSTAYNVHQAREFVTSSYQYGGCSTTVLNEASHSFRSSGRDPSGLGRWSFIRLRGKQISQATSSNRCDDGTPVEKPRSRDLVVVSAYRPNSPGIGASTVWAQQRVYFNSLGRKIDPRLAFMVDLEKAIRQWRDEGCEVIVGVDANEDTRAWGSSSFRTKMKKCGLSEAILSRHSALSAATHQRNQKDQPIDGIFVTAGVNVLKGGYYGFDEYAPSDHRALWIDIDLKATLGGKCPSKRSFPNRKLSMLDTQSVKKYLDIVSFEYSKFSIERRLDRLTQSLKDNNNVMDLRLQRRFNCLHRQVYDIRRLAESKCRRMAMGNVPWSPTMQGFWDRLSLWKILLKGRRRCRVSSRKVRRLMKKTNQPSAWKLTTAEIEVLLQAERKAYKNAKSSANQLRNEHITAQVKVAKRYKWRSKKFKDRYQRLRRMKLREEARRRRRARGKGSSGGLKAIQVERLDFNGKQQLATITDPKLVELGCIQENRMRYDQTRSPYSTPPMESPLYDTFVSNGSEEIYTSLLQGRWPIPSSVDPATSLFLEQCRVSQTHKSTPMRVSTVEHTEFWKRNPENKGSEPHGLHNGHFKAGALSPLVAKCDALLRNIPITTGFVPDQWKHLMNFAIEKKPGDFRLSKMRTIQLMNSEFQANNKKIGRSAMAFAEEHHLIPSGQCGSRKHHQAIDLALSKRLVWDLLILQRRSAGWISNDAKSCFDRVVHWVAIVALLRFGITWSAATMLFNTLSSSTHRVRTGHGDSSSGFGPPTSIPFQGCGQGNGAGPAIWVAISAILITMMDSRGFGFECLTALDLRSIFAQCFCFVDDTDVMEAAKTVDATGESICGRVQQAASIWSGGIKSTGGAINPDKSFWWLLDFKWDPTHGSWKFRSSKEMAPDFQLQIQGLSHQPCILNRLEPHQAERTLGVMLAPLDSEKTQVQILRSTAKEWAEQVRSGYLQRYDVFPLIKSTVMKSLEYPMALTTIDEHTWRSIVSPVLQVCLPKAGICRHFPRSLALAPLKFHGLGLPNPFACQVFHHAELLLRHMANLTKTGAYLEANLQAHQLETGTSFGLLQQNYHNTGILASDTWLKRVWKEFDSLDMYVSFDSPSLSLKCEGDCLLMESFMDLEVDQEVLLWLNWCRIYLRVCSLSDIVTADGLRIRSTMLFGQRDDQFQADYQWPRSERPSQRHWLVWQQTLTRAFLCSDDKASILRSRLGTWTDNIDRWNWLFSPSTDIILHREGQTWKSFLRSSSGRRPTFEPSPQTWWSASLPGDLLRASVQLIPESTSISLYATSEPQNAQPTATLPSLMRAWHASRLNVDEFTGWVPDEIEIIGDEAKMAHHLLAGSLRIVSDGSYKNDIGTAAVQLLSRTGNDKIIVRCQTPGLPADQSAYRSELIGLLSSVMVVGWLIDEWAPNLSQKPRVKIACDGLSALQQSFHSWPAKPTQSQFDLVTAIRVAVHRSRVAWSPRHVHGHLDDKMPRHLLNWWEKRNMEVDAWAVQFRKLLERQGRISDRNPRFFSEPVSLFIGGTKQSALTLERIQEWVALPFVRQRWRDNHILSAEAEAEVDWTALRRGMHSLQPCVQRWIAKHSMGMCGVGKFQKIWGFESTDQCPLCGLPEDHLHVPRCQSSLATVKWQTIVMSFNDWLTTQLTAPDIQHALAHLIATIRTPATLEVDSLPDTVVLAAKSQLSIGLQGLLEGRISHQWSELQNRHFRKIGSRRSAPLWAARLTQQLILLGYYMWKHRNSVKYSEANILLKERSQEVNDGIRSQFDMGPQDLPTLIRPMLKPGLLRVLRQSLEEKETWLTLVSHERDSYKRTTAAQRRSFRKFFPPAPT